MTSNRFYAMLQEDIEAQPSNYLWSHKRWKNLYSYK
jgi:lauroyl/myristoyl acyltransferase